MKTLFLGGDKRQLEIINNLNKDKNNIDVVGYSNINIDKNISKVLLEKVKIKNYDVIIFPVSGVKEDFSITSIFDDKKITLPLNFLIESKKQALIFTGVKTQALKELLKIADRDAIALMEDLEVIKENSIPTVEGIIGDLIYNTETTIDNTNTFVIGYGNVGKRLVKTLRHLGANTTVGVKDKTELNELIIKDFNVLYTSDKEAMTKVISDSDIIINTVPNLIIDKDYLKVVNKEAYILDISSYPYGVDFNTANKLNIKNKLYLAIPSIVAPKTAGLILTKKINSIIGGKKND